jgi:hypothetical protein
MTSNHDFSAIDALNLDAIKVKLMHQSGQGWSLEHANAMEFEYRRFLTLMKMYPTEQTAPFVDVDIFWHYHILDTLQYAIDCEAVFGYFLHHFPYIGLRGASDEGAHQRVGDRMKQLYRETFGEDYPHVATAAAAPVAAAPAGTAYCSTPVQIADALSQTAYCSVPVQTAAAKTAYCSVTAGTRQGDAHAEQNRFYSERPVLTA